MYPYAAKLPAIHDFSAADLAEQVTAIRKAESRTISELFREAFRTYRPSYSGLLDASQQAGRQQGHMGLHAG